MSNYNWLNWAKEIQFIAQAGITYTKDVYDLERFERLREIAAEMVSKHSDLPIEVVLNLFCNESGYQTPKMDCRGVVFNADNQILLVQERDHLWSLPGGWIDVIETVKSNTEKEVKEESGLDVIARRVIALLDYNKNNEPLLAHGICKVFIECEMVGGSFQTNNETINSGYFSLDNMPPLAVNKVTQKQIEMCFNAHNNETWTVIFD